MGYDMNVAMKVVPQDRFDEVADHLDNECNFQFDNPGDGSWGWEQSGMIRWPDLTENMCEVSRNFPGVLISIREEGEDGQEWVEHFFDGRTYIEARPEWEPAPFDATNLEAVKFLAQ